ncbi:hypothetical protein GWO43_15445 [candidate division KSB1 bacterium]|nr:hypothetical protein [candidate division KSB1 bacterium]NIR68385.1 hypothetical protein [candidate division KSB1 bacterium]NIS25329.1 hypothetical protein [candidate division KSB1 bacterium]NIT72240.1 hypothetical protein [candidate division KSB1 bacterium]NIU26048.1 hypothetical protein [candidate division KSB1 bacterium]
MLDIFNWIFNTIFNILFLPFKNIDPVWGMLVSSIVTGIVMLFIFKATSDQVGIKKAKNLLKGHFLAIRLYRDDISIMFDTMKNILLANLLYMKKSVRPMLFLLVPVVIILLQLGSRYEFRPFNVGETIVVSLRLDDSSGNLDLDKVQLSLPEGLRTDMPPVRVKQLREVNWRIKAKEAGIYDLSFKYEGQVVNKEIHVMDSLVPVASSVARDNVTTTLMNPGEASLPGSSIASMVSVTYPRRDFEVLGFNLHWLVAFFIFSLIAAFSCKGLFGVEV